jgi:hypothetical protein
MYFNLNRGPCIFKLQKKKNTFTVYQYVLCTYLLVNIIKMCMYNNCNTQNTLLSTSRFQISDYNLSLQVTLLT